MGCPCSRSDRFCHHILRSHDLVKLISSAKLLIYAAASIGACPRSKTPSRAITAHAIRAILLAMATEATRARRLSGKQSDEARIDRAGFLLGVSNQRGRADNQELAQISVAHFCNAPQAFFAPTRTLPRGQPQPGGELAP